jgi:hypothetical protein
MPEHEHVLSFPPFRCNEGASVVHGFLFGVPSNRRFSMQDGGCECVFWLRKAPDVDALYAIEVHMRLYTLDSATYKPDGRHNTGPAFVNARVAVIELTSQEAGCCDVTLNTDYIHHVKPYLRFSPDYLTVARVKSVIEKFLRLLWREHVIRGWEEYVAERDSKPRIAEEQPRPAPVTEPQRLPEPGGENLDQWFDYYYAMKSRGWKFTLADIAEKTGYSYGHVRNKKAEYDAEHGTTKE